jgi:ABC-type multidrug transport system ATPase subunit/peptidoglycan/LPS O-acetylase OafA/YrhL
MASNERWHSLDAVRGGALLLGVVFHAGFSFIPGMIAGIWATADNSPSVAISALLFVSHIFRMSLFFFIAGFFAHMMLEKKGPRRFWADRSKRILGPLVVGWVLLFPAVAVVWSWGIARFYADGPPALPAGVEMPAPPPLAFPLTHLWFLYVLFLLYVATVAGRSVVAKLDRGGALRAGVDRAVGALVQSGAAALVLGLPLAALLYAREGWIMFFGIPTPDQSFIPPLAAFVGFGTAFAFGWLVHRQPALLDTWKRSWAAHLAGAVAATAICLYILGPVPQWVFAVTPAVKAIYALSYATAIWCWSFALLGLALRFCAVLSPVRRYIADSSYWIYLVHLPVVGAFQVLVAQWPLHWSVKFPLVLAASFAVLFSSYHWLVRSTFIGEVLNGRKYPRARPAGPTGTEPEPPRAVRRFGEGESSAATRPSEQPPAQREVLAELVGVRKRYGKTVALDGIDLDVRRGELLAVLGPNGAGKTTAISAWLGLTEVDEGDVRLMGRSPFDVEGRREVGVMMQEVALSPTLRVRELVELAASYYPNPLSAREALALTRTTEIGERYGAKLSGGQKRQAQFAMAVCGRPRLLFLDEPTASLDVQARETMWATIRELLAQGCSIVLTTHYLEEAEALADRVAVIAKGKLIALGTVDEVRSVVSRKTIVCSSVVDLSDVRAWPNVVDARRETEKLHITASDAESVVRRLLAVDERLSNLEVRQAGLAEAFTELTKEAA